MKKFIFLALFIPASLWSQNIDKMEYFIDNDPGFGMGINVVLTAATDITNLNIPVDLSAVSEGFHKMYVRSRDVNQKWSETTFHAFYKAATPVVQTLPNLVEFEYFVNSDPGVGNGIKKTVPAATFYNNYAFNACMTNAVTGANKLYVRTKDANGKWSETTTINFTFSGTAPTNCNAVLPIELHAFTGKITEGGALLSWETLAEMGLNNFELEKSLDAKAFSTIVTLKTNNTPSVYSTIDDKFLNSTYYRLKINDLDGSSNYSKIIFLEKSSDKSIKISQHTEGSILIETNDKIELITLANSIGQLIKSTKEKRFLIEELNAGIYIISVKTDKGFLSKKVFKE
jgi:hypothetical protein